MPRRPQNSTGRPPEPGVRIRTGRAVNTRGILDELFAHPPVSRAELEQRLAPASALEARRAIIDRLARGDVEESEGDLLVSIFHILGVGRESQALLDVVADPRRPRHVRACALTVLLHADPVYSDRLREVLSEEDLLSLAAQPLCQFLCQIESDREEAEQLAMTLESVPEDLRGPLFNHLDQFRRRSGVPAAVAYEQVLRRPALAALHQPILAALGEEGGRDAISLVEALRAEAADPATARTLQGLLLRLRTRTLEGRVHPLGTTRAYISSCDGQSAFFVLGERENPDGTHTLALLCIRAAGDIRDGYVATRQPKSQVRSLLGRFTTDAGTEFVQLSLEQAAPVVAQAVKRTAAEGRSLPDGALPALRFFERVEPRSLPSIARARRATLASLRSLLQSPPYARSWFVDPSDMEGSNLDPPPTARPSTRWLSRSVTTLARSPILIARVAAMARHMAVWHQLRGESAPAGLLLAAAEDTEREPAKSALLRVLLERLCAPEIPDEPEAPLDPLGEPSRRQFLKSRFFLDVAAPKGRDLALLDFTEAALLGLERALETIPGEARPREDAIQETAHSIARLFRDYVFLSRSTPPSRLSDQMAGHIARACALPADECHRLALMMLTGLVAFVDEVCGECPVRCLNRPRAAVAREFFSPMHPALGPVDEPHPQV